MVFGILLIAAGILIAVYPPLLSWIVATVLIFAGMFLFLLGYYYRKMSRDFENPVVNFFFRF
jgi:Flp pilus assembly protein TadB